MSFILLVFLSSYTFGEELLGKETLVSVLKELNALKGNLKQYESKMSEFDRLKARTDALEEEVANLKKANERLQREVRHDDADLGMVQPEVW